MKQYCVSLLFWLLVSSSLSLAQAPKPPLLDRFRVDFTDKKGTTYSIARPWEFLSSRALMRRIRYGIPLTLDDLPLAERYVDAVKTIEGIKVLNRSRWFNSITVQADSNQIAKIRKLPFVRTVAAVGKTRRPRASVPGAPLPKPPLVPHTDQKYGFAKQQIEMLNGIALHDMGFEGMGMVICVMDGGFQNVDVMPFFDSLRLQGRIVATHDFNNQSDFVYDHSAHGTQVLSTIAADMPGVMVGTAPKASFVLLKTEDVGSESRVEEDNWVAGIEYADSLGVDVVSSSLGYTTFEYAQLNYTFTDLNGHTSRASRAAAKAAQRGILVVNSAGNSGGDDWKFLGVPADADSILTVGAVDRYKERAYFSSFGPTADGRIKPNIATRGFDAIVASLTQYRVDSASGTSFSAPIAAGMAAALWQGTYDKKNIEVIDALQRAGSQAEAPDNALGWGVPDFYKAYYLLSDGLVDASGDDEIFLNTADELNIITRNPLFNSLNPDRYFIRIVDIFGQEVYSRETLATNALHRQNVQYWDRLPQGSYTVFIRRGRETFNLQIMKGRK